MNDFTLELVKDFLFVEQANKVQVGKSDFYIDLLFYQRGIQCLVSIRENHFRPQHLGQITFYLEALNAG